MEPSRQVLIVRRRDPYLHCAREPCNWLVGSSTHQRTADAILKGTYNKRPNVQDWYEKVVEKIETFQKEGERGCVPPRCALIVSRKRLKSSNYELNTLV